MATYSYLCELAENINKLLPPIYKVGCSKVGVMVGRGNIYSISVDLVSAADNGRTLISRKKLKSGSLKECTIYLDGMYNSLLLAIPR